MSGYFTDQSAVAQTAFVSLSQAAVGAALTRSISDLPGGFAMKTVMRKSYWYYQRKDAEGRLRQAYIGPDSPEIRALIEKAKTPSSVPVDHLARLTASCVALGCTNIVPKHARVIRRLSEHGFFNSGGILVGTHAFLSYQNYFGLIWSSGNATVDLDFAHAGKNISVALPATVSTNTRKAIESLNMGFVPNITGTTFRKADEPDFDLDFLTSRSRDGEEPIFSALLNVSLQPLPFMEFSMESPITTVVLDRFGPVVVNIPSPERYAVHKLIVFGERPQGQRAKSMKDIVQAAALFSCLSEVSPLSLKDAWADANSRGRGWRTRLETGLTALERSCPEVDFRSMVETSEPEESPSTDTMRNK